MDHLHDLPLLGGIAGFIRWCEELISLLSGPLLTVGLAIALIDLLTGGDLLRAFPELLFAWGVCQAVGIDAQLVATWDKCRQAIRSNRWLAVVGLVLLGLVLGYVGFLSAEAFGFQHAFGVSEADALSRLGIDAATWQFERAALAVFLVALSGFTRYHPPARNVSLSADAEQEKLQAELRLEPLRQQLRQQQVRGARGAVAAALGREAQTAPVVDMPLQRAQKPDRRPPTGPGSPSLAPVRTPDVEPPGVLRLPAPQRPRRTAAQARTRRRATLQAREVRTGKKPWESYEAEARAAWADGSRTLGAMTKATGMSKSVASKWVHVLEAEGSNPASEQLAQ